MVKPLAGTNVRYIVFGKVDEFGGREPAIDTSSFSLMEVTVLAICADEDGLDGAEVRLEDGATTWYEKRFLLTEDRLRALKLPVP